MKKMLLILPCILILVGCQEYDNNKSTEFEINAKYEEMKNKLIEYGKLVYENEQWLNDNSNIVTSYMSLNDLRERNGYDISMFKNSKTGNQCNLDETYVLLEVLDKQNGDGYKYLFSYYVNCEE